MMFSQLLDTRRIFKLLAKALIRYHIVGNLMSSTAAVVYSENKVSRRSHDAVDKPLALYPGVLSLILGFSNLSDETHHIVPGHVAHSCKQVSQTAWTQIRQSG